MCVLTSSALLGGRIVMRTYIQVCMYVHTYIHILVVVLTIPYFHLVILGEWDILGLPPCRSPCGKICCGLKHGKRILKVRHGEHLGIGT